MTFRSEASIASNTFPRAARLRKRREFLAVQRKGSKRVTHHFIVLIATGTSQECRLGVTASKRVGNAVIRNAWKRRIRESFRHIRQNMPSAWDIVIIARSNRTLPSYEQSLLEISRAINSYSRASQSASRGNIKDRGHQTD